MNMKHQVTFDSIENKMDEDRDDGVSWIRWCHDGELEISPLENKQKNQQQKINDYCMQYDTMSFL